MTWSYALCQHPMYMIIEHDETAAERTPPWGAPDIESYVNRIRRNLAALEQYPFLKFNYDFSGVELEDLAERAPDVIDLFKRYLHAGRIGFVNGSYAQAHLHTLGPESNLRQMQEGLAVIERLVGVRVDTYAHQEPAIHDQMPQILTALGYKFAVTPGFFYTLSFLTPHEILGVQYQGLRYLQDEEFAEWLGLDGAGVPLYLSQPRLLPAGSIHGSDSHQVALRTEFVKGLLHYPPIRCDFPDMVEVDQAWLDDMAGQAFVVLAEALAARLKESPIRSRARLYTYWGYGDGLEAERLHRADHLAERTLLEAESLAALAHLLADGPEPDLAGAWRRLLRAQHHDAYWVAGIGLREKAVQWALEAKVAAEAAAEAATGRLMARVKVPAGAGERPLFVWEAWPLARTDAATVALDVPADGPAPAHLQVRDPDGAVVPSQIIQDEAGADCPGSACLLFMARTAGLGYQTVAARAEVAAPPEGRAGSLAYENDFYRVEMRPDGTIGFLAAGGGQVLIEADKGPGNRLKALSPGGEPLYFAPTDRPEIETGAVAQVVRLAGWLGSARVRQTVLFYHHLPRIDFTLSFDFDETLYGNYWQDESKLNVYWPVAARGDIVHDIPFGVIQGREQRPFFATSWVRLGSERAGLAFFHRGTNRFWVKDNVLANVLACGLSGRDIGTRARPELYIKEYDLRLKGRHVLHYAVYPHEGDWREAGTPAQAFSYKYPLRVTEGAGSQGDLPPRLSLARLEAGTLIPTAVSAADGRLTCRLFETTGATARPDVACLSPWRAAVVRTLAGKEVETIDPYTIAEIVLER